MLLLLPALVRADGAPSLPAFEGSMGGGTGGEGADASSGVAGATYPLLLPPARGTIQPILGLSYGHTARLNITEVGAGWSLGLPSIERTAAAGGPPRFDATDVFRLAGARLTYQCTVSNGSCNGEPMPHWATGLKMYRPDVDSSYTRAFVESSSDPGRWRVQSRSGDIMEFGQPTIAPSATDATAGYDRDQAGTAFIYRWKLVRQYEAYASGNSAKNVVIYGWRRWSSRSTADISTLEDIFYTPSVSGGVAQVDQYAHHVRLRYQDRDWKREDSRFVIERPWSSTPERLVESIDVASRGLDSARALVRRYRLTYQTISGRPYLANIVLEGRCSTSILETVQWDGRRDASMLPPTNCPRATPGTTYTYSHGGEVVGGAYLGARAPVKITFPAGLTISPSNLAAIDADRDGLVDLVQTNPPKVFLNRGRAGEPVARDFEQATLTVNSVVSFNKKTAAVFGPWDDSWGATWLTNFPSSPLQSNGGPGNVAVLTGSGGGFAIKTFTSLGCCAFPLPTMPPAHLFGDLDGDGSPDAIYLDETVSPPATRLRLSRRELGVPGTGGRTRPLSAIATTNLRLRTGVFSPRVAALGDVNGDAIDDYITTRWNENVGAGGAQQDSLVFIPGRGDGRFDCGITNSRCVPAVSSPGYNSATPSASAKEVLLHGTAADDPTAELKLEHPGQFTFADLTGDGRIDVVSFVHDPGLGYIADVWVNVDGTGEFVRDRFIFQAPDFDLSGVLQAGDPVYMPRLLFGDVDGDAVQDLILCGDNECVYRSYTPFMPSGQLLRIDHINGGTTEFDYFATLHETELEQQAEPSMNPWPEAGPWTSHIPVSMWPVKSVRRFNNAPSPYSVALRTDYFYRDPTYDRWAATFRGFRRVRKVVANHATDTRLHFEGCIKSDSDARAELDGLGGPTGAWGCSAPNVEGSPVANALNGRPVQIEQLEPSTGIYFSTVTFKYDATNVSASAGSFVYASEINTFLYDTASYSASTSTEVLYTPTNSPYEVTTRALAERLRRRQIYDSYGNLTFAFDDGRVTAAGAARDRPIRTKNIWQPTDTFVPTSVSAVGRQYLLQSASICYAGTTTEACGAVGPAAILNASDQLDGPPRSTIHGYDSLARLTKVQQTILGTVPLERPLMGAPSPSPLEGVVVDISSVAYDAFGNVVTQYGATPGECTTTTYETQYADHPRTTTTWLGGGCNTGNGLATSMQVDRGIARAIKVTGVNGIEAGTDFDGFARPITTWVKPYGGSRVDRTSLAYSPFGQAVSWTSGTRLATNPANVRTVFTFADAWRTTLAVLTTADVSAGDGGEWVVKSAPSLDIATGRPVEWFRPTFYSGSGSAFVVGPPAGESVSSVAYDFMGRVVDRYRSADAHLVDHRQYHALETDYWDAENIHGGSNHLDMTTSIATDGHGRMQTKRKNTEGGVLTTKVDYLATGELAVLERWQGDALLYRRWMRRDSRGLVVENAEPNTSTGFVDSPAGSTGLKAWRYTYDSNGRMTGTRDARGCGKNLTYDRAGRPVAEDYSPCISTQTYTPYDAATGNGSEKLYKYDTPESGQTTDYGASVFLLQGQLVSVRDLGSHTRYAYDTRGRVVGTARRVAKPGPPVSTLSTRYTSNWFHAGSVFDEVDRVEYVTTGADIPELLTGAPGEAVFGTSYLKYSYTGRDLIDTVAGSYGLLVHSQRYAADGAPEHKVFGDADATEIGYTYNNKRELWTYDVGRPSAAFKLISQAYTYDEVGNITSVQDGRDPFQWETGAMPISRTMSYDAQYQLNQVNYDPQGDSQVSPFAPEEAASSSRPLPRIVNGTRLTWQSFLYDGLGNVVDARDSTDTSFDRGLGAVTVGNRSYATDEDRKPNRVLYSNGETTGSTEAHYDAAGNLIDLAVDRSGDCSSPSGKCSHRFVYDWNEVGELVRARRWDFTTVIGESLYPDDPTLLGPAAIDLRYTYSGGHRIIKTSTETSGDSHTVDIFGTLRLMHAGYVGGNYERSADTEIVYLPGFGRVQYSPGLPNAGSDLHVFLEFGDHLGNATAIIDMGTSQVVEYATYLAYGATESDYRPAAWQGFREEHRFTGKEEDIEVGLTYFGARYYSPYLTRFISPDPLTIHAMGADLNPYAYVGGRVFNATDPLGLERNYTPNPTSSDGNANQSTGPGLEGLGTWETKEFCGCNRNPYYASGRSNESNSQTFTLPPPPPTPSPQSLFSGTNSYWQTHSLGGIPERRTRGDFATSMGYAQYMFDEHGYVPDYTDDPSEALWDSAMIREMSEAGVYTGWYGEGGPGSRHLPPPHVMVLAVSELGPAAVIGEVSAVEAVVVPAGTDALAAGRAFEAERLAAYGAAKNTTVFRPTAADVSSAAFKVVVGDAKYTAGGELRGTILDSVDGGLLEIKGGTSPLSSTYQLRLQTYYSLKLGQPLTIRTMRVPNTEFSDWLNRWGVQVAKP